MTLDEIRAKLFEPSFHACAVCLRVGIRVHLDGREGGGTRAMARCHGRWMATVIPDSVVEDRPRFYFFDGVEGEPFEDAKARARRELSEDLERVRAARAMQEEG